MLFRSAVFYQKLFGEAQRTPEPPRIAFQLGKSNLLLAPVESGQRPGIEHFCVLVQTFDPATAVRRLQERGAVMHARSTPASALFRDPDGVMVQVIARG